MRGEELMEVISSVANIAWGRCCRWEGHNEIGKQRPPVTAWRYQEEQPSIEETIKKAVQSFKGQIAWYMYKPTRNWVIKPLAVQTFSEENNFRVDIEEAIAFGKQYPEVVNMAFEDLPLLSEHVKRALGESGKSGDTILIK